jgi:hypothetical protein
MRKNIALDIVGDLRRIRFQIDDLTTRIKIELAASGTQLAKIPGVGTVTAARILARTSNPTRFANEAAYASYTGTAPVEVASANKQCHRLSRSGDRSLNAAIHIVAVTQARTPSSDGYAYHQRKMAEGKTSREGMRCLKRQVAKRLWRTMRTDCEERLALPVSASTANCQVRAANQVSSLRLHQGRVRSNAGGSRHAPCSISLFVRRARRGIRGRRRPPALLVGSCSGRFPPESQRGSLSMLHAGSADTAPRE